MDLGEHFHALPLPASLPVLSTLDFSAPRDGPADDRSVHARAGVVLKKEKKKGIYLNKKKKKQNKMFRKCVAKCKDHANKKKKKKKGEEARIHDACTQFCFEKFMLEFSTFGRPPWVPE